MPRKKTETIESEEAMQAVNEKAASVEKKPAARAKKESIAKKPVIRKTRKAAEAASEEQKLAATEAKVESEILQDEAVFRDDTTIQDAVYHDTSSFQRQEPVADEASAAASALEIYTEDLSENVYVSAPVQESAGLTEVQEVQDAQEPQEERPEVEGFLELAEGGFGFLRFNNFLTSDKDVYVSPAQIRRFGLRTGDKINGISRLPRGNERFGALLYVNSVNGEAPGTARNRPRFDELTPIFPNEKIVLENSSIDLATRIIDLVAPIGKGQRGLIVAPPKAGKTVLLKRIAASVEAKYPDIEMIVLLVDERPEEVTDMKRSLERAEVIYSTFDEQASHHVKVAEMVLQRAKRLAESGKDVMILLDSITRLARAYNMSVESSGRTLSGGLDPAALHPPKKFFGAARNLEEGGSITILATALVDTGSRMDDVIYEEFKGTGNMELHLNRALSERRIFPAIDLNKSGTRREDLLLTPDEFAVMYQMRREMSNGSVADITEDIIDNMSHTRNNADFVNIMKKRIY